MAIALPRGAPQPVGAAAAWDPERRTALYNRHAALGARFIDVAGWRVPDVFCSAKEEAAAARVGVGLMDLSPLGKLRLVGQGAAARIASYVPEGVAPSPGQVSRTQHGAGPDSRLLLGLASDEFLLLTPPEWVEATIAELEAILDGDGSCVHLADLTSTFLAIGLVGPRANELMRHVSSLDLRPWRFPGGACALGSVAEIPSIIIRLDCGEVPSYRLLATRAYGEYLWDALCDAGRELGVTPVGQQAWIALGG